VMWGSPAFEAAITEGMQILAIDGKAYSADSLKRTITAAANPARSDRADPEI